MNIKFKKLSQKAEIPKRETSGAVGLDLATTGDFETGPHGVVYWKTALSVEPPEGYYLEIHPRSSLHKKGWMLVNSTGIIDSDYRGELKIPLIPIDVKNIFNGTETEIEIVRSFAKIEPGTRIAQLILRKNELLDVNIEESDTLSETKRGSGGFGSTG